MYRLIDILSTDVECSSCSRPSKLYEAYSENAIKGFLDRFKEQADDLNIDIDEKELRTLIKIFDKTKEGLAKDKRDLAQWELPDLIRFATKGATGKKIEGGDEKAEITPDVVYHNNDNSIIIYNGSTEGNCIKFGKGEKWCITRSSFPNYRYSEGRGYPTFYLAKNLNLPESNKLSFVAIQVRDPKQTNDSNRYVYTNRVNSPHESNSMSIETLKSEVPWLKEVPNLRSVLKYIPLTSAEKLSHQYKYKPITYKEWTKLPFAVKEQYLVVRKDSGDDIFKDITDEKFVSTHLKNFPDILKFVAETPDIVDKEILLQNLEIFPDSARKSIVANLGSGLDIENLDSSQIPFDVKKLLVKQKKWALRPQERLYITNDGNTIVKLTVGDKFQMGLYQAEDDFPNVKLNKRTSKYLLDYPELDKIPFYNILDLSQKGVLDSEIVQKVIDNAKQDPNSTITVQDTNDGEVIIDSSNLKAYKLKNGKLTPALFNDEEVQGAFRSSLDNEAFKKNVINIAAQAEGDLPKQVNFDTLASIIDTLPDDQKVLPVIDSNGNVVNSVALVDRSEGKPIIFFMRQNPEDASDYFKTVKDLKNGVLDVYNYLSESQIPIYLEYLRRTGKQFDDDELVGIFRSLSYYGNLARKFAASNPPLNPNNVYKLVYEPNSRTIYLLNSVNRKESKKVSPATGNLVRAPLSQDHYDRLMPRQQQEPQQGTQQAVQVQPQQAAQQRTYWQQPAPTGDINIQQVMQDLGASNQFVRIPSNDRRRLNITNGAPLNVRTDGGARRRNQLLGDAGQVEAAYAALTSRIYIIRLANGTRVISIKVYPGNREYLLIPGQRAYQVNEPAQLLNLLRQNNLAEARKYFIRTYLDANPGSLDELKEILRQHLNK